LSWLCHSEHFHIYVVSTPKHDATFCCQSSKGDLINLPIGLGNQFQTQSAGSDLLLFLYWLINITAKMVESTNTICKFNGECYQILFSHINLPSSSTVNYIFVKTKHKKITVHQDNMFRLHAVIFRPIVNQKYPAKRKCKLKYLKEFKYRENRRKIS
jgi:hypothetical protein